MEIETSEIKHPEMKKPGYKRFYYVFVLVIVFGLGLFFGSLRTSSSQGLQPASFVDRGREGAPQEVDWNLLWDAIDSLNERFVGGPVDSLDVLYGAISGAVGAADDQYTTFLPPQEAADFQDELSGNFEGIGAEIAIRDDRLVVVAPLDGSPAKSAGLRAGDYIVKVDQTDTEGLNINESVSIIRGPSGTEVVLTVFRDGEEDFREITITRAQIEVKSVSFETQAAGDQKIGVIRLRRFGLDTQGVIEDAINNFLVENVSGVIVDVRNNPGGFLETAVEVAGNWVDDGEIVVLQEFGDGGGDEFRAEGTPRLQGVPTVVLMNEGSASASEILAGALKDYGLATLVGEQSFGKGSVQELVNLDAGADLKVTIAKWLTPNGHDLNEEGLAPDVEVELSEEDFNADRDPQLDRALEILTE